MLDQNDFEGAFEAGFDDLPNPKQEEKQENENVTIKEDAKPSLKDENISFKKEKSETETPKESKIKIDISSVEQLISELSYTAKEFEKSADKLLEKQELGKILKILEKIQSNDLQKLEDTFKDIDVKFIENIIRKNIENTTQQVDNILSLNLNKIKKETKKVTETYKEYAQALSDADSIEAFENIQKIQKFTKNFKFRSAIVAAIISATITAVTTATVTYISMEKYNEIKVQQKLQKYGKAGKVLQDKNIEVYQDDKTAQLIFSKDENIQCFTADDGRRVIQFEK